MNSADAIKSMLIMVPIPSVLTLDWDGTMLYSYYNGDADRWYAIHMFCQC